jgi:hypothetical protein
MSRSREVIVTRIYARTLGASCRVLNMNSVQAANIEIAHGIASLDL